MSRATQNVEYYRKMESVVINTMTRLLKTVITQRPKSSKEVLTVIARTCKENLISSSGWLCGGCAFLNDQDQSKCGSCDLIKDGDVPQLKQSDGPLLTSIHQNLTRREDFIKLREQELGISAGSGTAKGKATAANDAPSRFDGTDAGGSQERIPEQPKLIPKGYAMPPSAASVDGRAALKFIGKWYSPLGIPLWREETIEDFVSDGDFLVHDNRHKPGGGDPPVVVRALFAYTHSQLGPRTVWAIWKPERNVTKEGDKQKKIEPAMWEPIHNPSELEESYEKHEFHVTPTPEICKALKMTAESIGDKLKLTHLQSNPKIGLKGYKTSLGNVFIARYDNKLRGHKTYSPLRDAVMWLPRGDQLKHVIKENVRANVLPTAGVLEYIAANPASRKLDLGGQVWSCQPYVDEKLGNLIQECLKMANQQHACKKLHKKAMMIIESPVLKQEGFPKISSKAFKNCFTSTTRIDNNSTLTPEEIARAFTLQCVTWNENHFLLALTTTPIETRTPHTLCNISTGDVHEMYRVVTTFWPEQIFNNLNMSMRETQFGNPDAALTFNPRRPLLEDGFFGRYTSKQPSTFGGLESEIQPAMFKSSCRGLFGTGTQTEVKFDSNEKCWAIRFASGVKKTCDKSDVKIKQHAWMLPQVRPLIYVTNKALSHIHSGMSEHDKKTYRGMSCSLSRSDYDIGKVLVWAQYSSTSVDQGVAADFAKGENPAAVFTIRGNSCVPIANYSRFAREAEVLYRENTCFKVQDALSAEAAQILGKENLQIFTLEEISETQMACTLVRKMLPMAETSAAASVVFQCEEALRGDRCLELSIDTVNAGEVPARWQYFFNNPTHNCPIQPSTVWENWEFSGLAKIKRARDNLITKVDETETIDSILYVRDQPEGQPGTLDLHSVKVTGGNPNMNGTYKRNPDAPSQFDSTDNDENNISLSDEGKSLAWVLSWSDGDSLRSPHLLGDWPGAEGADSTSIKVVVGMYTVILCKINTVFPNYFFFFFLLSSRFSTTLI